jgi:hypothetical protein
MPYHSLHNHYVTKMLSQIRIMQSLTSCRNKPVGKCIRLLLATCRCTPYTASLHIAAHTFYYASVHKSIQNDVQIYA